MTEPQDREGDPPNTQGAEGTKEGEKIGRSVLFIGNANNAILLTSFVTFSNDQVRMSPDPQGLFENVKSQLLEQAWRGAANHLLTAGGNPTAVKMGEIEMEPMVGDFTRASVVVYIMPIEQLNRTEEGAENAPFEKEVSQAGTENEYPVAVPQKEKEAQPQQKKREGNHYDPNEFGSFMIEPKQRGVIN